MEKTTENKMNIKNIFNSSFIKDLRLSFLVMLIAGCGLIYQYLLASYSGRIIGVMEVAIFTIMTLMIVFMGIGSFFAKYLKNKFFAFSILESVIGIIPVVSIFLILGANAMANQLPEILANTFNMPVELFLNHGFVDTAKTLLNSISYIMASILGFFIGMEIPLLASIREKLHEGKDLDNNIGMIYGVDYIGAGIGAFIWIYILMGFEIQESIQIVAYTNVIVGFLFILMFKKHITKVKTALAFQIFTTIFIYNACQNLNEWQNILENSLYKDTVVHSENTKYQHFTVTQGVNKHTGEFRHSLFINGHTQFSDSDEGLYHSLLVYPALISAGLPDDVLVIGGGDGLAVRDILKTNPKSVTLLDLDSRLVEFFTKPTYDDFGNQINEDFINLTEGSFSDERVGFMFGDAYLNIKTLVRDKRRFGTIIVDLPDPSHPDLNKLYSKEFYENLNRLLLDSGSVAIQSTSPYAAKKAFVSIGKTLSKSGFYVNQYQHIIPSFNAQWGWTVGTKSLPYPKERLNNINTMPVDDEWLTKGKMLSTFEFGKNYYKDVDSIKVNTINNNATYNYYQKAWESLTTSVFE